MSKPDARVIQTQSALREAVLVLAARMPISDMTVAELTREAKISRVTFYDHYSAPFYALIEALTEELDELRRLDALARESNEHPLLEIEERSIARLAEHVIDYRAVYENALLASSKMTLHNTLVEYFDRAQREYLAKAQPAGMPPTVSQRAAANYVAHGMVGALEFWLQEGRESGEYRVEELAAVITALRPAWWRE